MTATPGSVAPTASEPAAPLRRIRFGLTERVAHWIHAAGFFAMLATGLVLYLPMLASTVGNRPLAKALHLASAALWLTGLALVATLGDRGALRRARRELERFDDDDLRWLRRRGPAPQGRFNAGQKAHTVIQAALATLFVVSGVLLWLGERATELRLPGTIAVHDVSMFAASLLVAGHLYLALVHEPTRPAMSGMVSGEVDAAWAREHHAKWHREDAGRPPRPGPARLALGLVIALAGVAGTVALVADVL